jgi:hypothetical protein
MRLALLGRVQPDSILFHQLDRYVPYVEIAAYDPTGKLDWELGYQSSKIQTPKSKLMALGAHAQLV